MIPDAGRAHRGAHPPDAVDLAPHGFAVLKGGASDPSSGEIQVEFANRAWQELVGTLDGHSLTRLREAVAALEADPGSREAPDMVTSIVDRKPDGRALEFTLGISGDSVVATARDVTDQLRAVEALRTSEERYRTLVDEVDAVISIDDRETGTIWVSPKAEGILGFSPQQLAERGFWRSIVIEEDQPRVVAVWDDDEDLDVYDLEYRVRRADGVTIWLHDRMSAVRGEDGAVVRWYGVAADVTSMVDLRTRQMQSARLETMGMFAGGVAHDFRNLLFGIAMYADLARRGLPPDMATNAELSEIMRIVERGHGLVSLLLSFARDEHAAAEHVDPAESLLQLQPLLTQLAGASVEVRVTARSDGGLILGPRAQFERVVLNLVANALQAMPDGGVLEIHSGLAASCSDPTGPNAVRLVVRDTGVGMDAETRLHAFDPFYTTRNRAIGTGLGLPTVRSIVSSLGGTIKIESEPGAGTTFEVLWPNVAGTGAGAPSSSESRPRPRPRVPRGHRSSQAKVRSRGRPG